VVAYGKWADTVNRLADTLNELDDLFYDVSGETFQ